MMVAPEREVPGIRAKHCDLQRVQPRHILSAVHPCRAPAAVYGEDDDAADDERQRHRNRLEEVGLDELAESEPQHRRRDEGHREMGGLLVRGREREILMRIRQRRVRRPEGAVE